MLFLLKSHQDHTRGNIEQGTRSDECRTENFQKSMFNVQFSRDGIKQGQESNNKKRS
jgi:hypothetical protein